MFDTVAAAAIGRRVARRVGFNGVLGAAAGVGALILLRRLAPSVAVAVARESYRRLSRRRSDRDADDNAQSAGA